MVSRELASHLGFSFFFFGYKLVYFKFTRVSVHIAHILNKRTSYIFQVSVYFCSADVEEWLNTRNIFWIGCVASSFLWNLYILIQSKVGFSASCSQLYLPYYFTPRASLNGWSKIKGGYSCSTGDTLVNREINFVLYVIGSLKVKA